MSQEKKFFAPQLRTYNNNLSKKWRIEWYVPDQFGRPKRCIRPVYGNINRYETVEDRTKAAERIIKTISFDLPKTESKNIFDKVFELKSIDWAPKTVSTYRTPINLYTSWLKKYPIEAVTPARFNKWILFLHSKGYNKNNIAKFRDTIFTFYAYAKSLKLTTITNPVEKTIRIKQEAVSLMFFSDDQIQQFKEDLKIPYQLWLAIQLLFYCYIRPGEQRHMRIEWINFEHRFIEIPGLHSKNRKTQKVSIPDAFYMELSHLKRYPNNYYVLSKSGNPGPVQISTKWLNDEHKKVLDRLTIRGRYAFYSWKTTGVVKAVKAGINIKDIQLQLRHHSLDMVNEYLKRLGIMDSEDLRSRFPSL